MTLSVEAIVELMHRHKFEGEGAETYQRSGQTMYEERMADFNDGYYSWDVWVEALETVDKQVTVDGLGVVSAAKVAGYDCDGGSVEFVFKVDVGPETRHFRITGYYSSYEGYEWDSNKLTEVEQYIETLPTTKYRVKPE